MKLPPKPRRRNRLGLEHLEDRATPAVFTVTDASDAIHPGNPLITLREALISAASNPGPDTIDFDASLAGATINLTIADSGLGMNEVGPSAFQIDSDVTILGSGQRLIRDSEAGAFRHFFVMPGGSLTLENLELENGLAIGGDGQAGGGGAAGLGGSIFNLGSLIIRNSTFVGNTAQGGNGSFVGEGAGGGGGLGSAGSIEGPGGGPNGGDQGTETPDGGFGGGGAAGIETAGGNGGFGGGGGGGAFGGSGGNGGFGGGGGGADSEDDRSGNGGFGGTDGEFGSGGGGAGFGGAIFNFSGVDGSAGYLTIVNSTFTQNRARGGFDGLGTFQAAGYGGAVFNLNGDATIVHGTFHQNIANEGGSLYNLSHDGEAGVGTQEVAYANINNSIFQDSDDPDAIGPDSLPAASGSEIVNRYVVNSEISAGSFLAQLDAYSPNITNGGGLDNVNGDFNGLALIDGATAVTGPLQNNGGPTRTLALLTGSPAIDAGDLDFSDDPSLESALEFDQRGQPRVSGDDADLGAFEFQVAPPPPEISIFATDPEADENTDGDVLVLTFTRTGDPSAELTFQVDFTTFGVSEADVGTYIYTGGFGNQLDADTFAITFTAGSDTVTLTIPVINDIHAEADESVTFVIPEQSGIQVGEANTATLTIYANDFVVINTNDSGEGSLRQAITNAENIWGTDTVTFIAALRGATIALTTYSTTETGHSAFIISSDVIIQGSGQIITRNAEASDFRFFTITSGEGSGSLTLENLEFNSGVARGGNGAGGGGGAAGLGGAIFNQGELIIRNSTFVNNVAQGGDAGSDTGGGGGGGLGGDGQSGPDGNGGGIDGGSGGVEGTGGSGGFGGGGGGDSSGESTQGGDGGFGGGGGGTAGGFGGNAGFGGGGGASFASGTPGFGVEDAGITRPEAGAGFGGAIFNYGGSVLLVNSTLTNNTAIGGTNDGSEGSFTQPGYGGGLFNLNGFVEVRNSTFASNRADVGGSLYNLQHEDTAGVYRTGDAVVELFNSIFVDSVLPEGGEDSEDEVHNYQQSEIVSQIQSGGAYIASIDAGAPNITNGVFVNEFGSFTVDGLIVATSPVVSSTLANNGGLTRTLRLLPGSQAIDAGDNDEAYDPSIGEGEDLEFDQRGPGFPRIRPADGTVDLGAFESSRLGIPDTIVITSPDFIVVQNGPEGAAGINDPFPDFHGENLVAVGDVNRDGIVDYIFSAGNLGGPRVQVFSGADGSVLYNFFAYDRDFRGGTYVAAGDIDGDGYADIITGAGMLGGPHVRVFSGFDGSLIANFFAFESGHRSGVTVAVGDVNGDGVLDIITGSGPGESSEIRIFDGTKLGQPDAHFASLFPYDESYRDGVFVAAGNLDGDRFADIVAGPLSISGTTQTVVFAGVTLSKVNSFFEDEPSLFVGIRFTIADANGDGIDDMVVVAAKGGGPRRIVVNPLTGEQIDNSFFDDEDVRSEGYGVGG